MSRVLITFVVIALFLAGSRLEAVPLDSLSKDEAAIAAHIKALHDVKSEVRAAAAEALRTIVAKYPSRTANIRDKDGGEAYWTEKINQIKPGMKKAEVLKIIPPFADSTDSFHLGSGQSHTDGYRLDCHWTVQVQYYNPDKVIERPKLIKRELRVFVAPPNNYTGTWICWHINGQKGYEVQYQNGKYNSVHTTFYDNGQKLTEQHYKNGVANGAGAGWYSGGEKSYTIQYQNGKYEGGTHWYSNGRKQSEAAYRNGEAHGVHAAWHENGHLRSVQTYRNGVKHGLEASWDEDGVLEYKREYQNGSIVD